MGARTCHDSHSSEFRSSVHDSKAALEALTGAPVLGYRAPSFSIVRGGEWAFDVLIEEGYQYDSSLYPVRRRGYGYSGGSRDPHDLSRSKGTIAELPPATIALGPVVLPAGGGAYFRLLPYALTATALARRSAEECPERSIYTHGNSIRRNRGLMCRGRPGFDTTAGWIAPSHD